MSIVVNKYRRQITRQTLVREKFECFLPHLCANHKFIITLSQGKENLKSFEQSPQIGLVVEMLPDIPRLVHASHNAHQEYSQESRLELSVIEVRVLIIEGLK